MVLKHKKNLSFLSATLFLPQITSAAIFDCAVQSCKFKDVVPRIIVSILKPIVPFIVGLTVVYFLWGVALYIKKAENESDREEGKKKMLYGIIALAVMLSFWGFARILKTTFFG